MRLTSRSTLVVAALAVGFLAGGFLTENVHAVQGKGDTPREAGRELIWSSTFSAKDEAAKKYYGIMYYFPPDGSKENHPVLETQAMFLQSLKSPFVKVTGEEDREILGKQYNIDPKRFTIVVTDWYGNEMARFEAKKKAQRLPTEQITNQIANARKHIEKLKKDVAKRFAKGQKQFDKKKWKAALKDLVFVAGIHGFDECEKAQAFLSDIIETGRERVAKAKHLSVTDSESAVKELKRIAREFKGSAVEAEANALIAELK